MHHKHQIALYNAIIDQNIPGIKHALLNGAKIINNSFIKKQKHTLNFALKNMFKKINKIDLNFIKFLMDQGAMVNNEDENTLSLCVQNVKKNNIDDKNLLDINLISLFKLLIDYKAEVDGLETFFFAINSRCPIIIRLISEITTKKYVNASSLSGVLIHVLPSLTDSTEIYIIDFIKSMIQKQVPADNSQTHNNTFSLAIKSGNLKLIKTIIEEFRKDKKTLEPNNNFDNESVTLSDAVNTRNRSIVKLAIDHGAIPCTSYEPIKNTLKCAIQSGDPEILRDIVINGGGGKGKGGTHWCWTIYSNSENNTFNIFYNKFFKESNEQIDSMNITNINLMINLLMCSGAKIPHNMVYKIVNKLYLTSTDIKLINCFDLLTLNEYNYGNYYIGNKNKLKDELINELKNTMLHLIENPKKDRIKLLFNTMRIIPCCLIYIIYEYYFSDPLIEFIDWNIFMIN